MATDMFPFLEVFVPFLGLGVLVLCCTTLCRACHAAQEGGRDLPDSPSVFIIPISTDDHAHSPPRYSTTDFSCSAPPPYAEVEMKPELFPYPEGVPPPYSERDPPYPSAPRLPPTAALLQQQSPPLRSLSYS